MKTIEYDPTDHNNLKRILTELIKCEGSATIVSVDPYREYRAAEAAGKIVQYDSKGAGWINPTDKHHQWAYCYPPERYRIKSEPRYQWQWIFTRNGHTEITLGFYETEEQAKSSLLKSAKLLRRADWTKTPVVIEQGD